MLLVRSGVRGRDDSVPSPPGVSSPTVASRRWIRRRPRTSHATCSWSAPDQPERRGDHAPACRPRDDRRRQGPLSPRQVLWRRPHHAGAARARAARARPRRCHRMVRRRRRLVALPVGARGLPSASPHGRYAAVAPRLELDAELVAVARRAGVDVRDGHGFAGIDAVTQTTSTSPSMVWASCAAATSWPPTACGARSATPSGRRSTATAGSGMHSASTRGNVTGPAAKHLIVWFDADLLPGYTPWSFPCPVTASTSASACCATAPTRSATWPSCGATSSPGPRAGGARRRVRARRPAHGVADPGSGRFDHASPPGRCCSSATPPPPPT